MKWLRFALACCTVMLACASGAYADSPRRLPDKQIRQLMADVETNVVHFRKVLPREMRTAKIRSATTEVSVADYLADLEATCGTMRDRFKSSYSASAEVKSCLVRAYPLERRQSQGASLLGGEKEWPRLQTSLKALATQYGVDFLTDPAGWQVRRFNDDETEAMCEALTKSVKSYRKVFKSGVEGVPPEAKKLALGRIDALETTSKELGKSIHKGTDPSSHMALIVAATRDVRSFLDQHAAGTRASTSFEPVAAEVEKLKQAVLLGPN